MIFEPAERVLLPTKDLLSYIFDDTPYDQDKPVSSRLLYPTQLARGEIMTDQFARVRFTSTRAT